MKRLLITTAISLFAIASVTAQQSDIASLRNTNSENPLGVKPSFSPSSLLDGSRISWSHSYSVSFFSGGSGSGTAGLLNSTMFYELSPKLSLALNFGVLHNNGSFFGANRTTDATFLPGFTLDYRPSEKMHMTLQVQRVSGLGSGYYNNSRYLHNDRRSVTSPWDF